MREGAAVSRRASPEMRELLELRLGEEAERLAQDAEAGAREDWRALARTLRERLADGAWTARPGAEEILLARALRAALDGRLDAEFLPERAAPGRGRRALAQALRTARAARLPWRLVARVADAPAAVDRRTLDLALAGPPFWLARDVRAAVMAVARAGAGGRGIAPDDALSGLLLDAYLHGVDEFLSREGRVFCRSRGVVIVFCKSRAQAQRTREELGEHLRASRGLELDAAATTIRRRRRGLCY